MTMTLFGRSARSNSMELTSLREIQQSEQLLHELPGLLSRLFQLRKEGFKEIDHAIRHVEERIHVCFEEVYGRSACPQDLRRYGLSSQ